MAKNLTLEEFLQEREHFSLGFLPTELPHPNSSNLAATSKDDLGGAIEILLDIDAQALSKMQNQLETLKDLHQSIAKTLGKNKKIFLVGCGATGRLSLVLEKLWRLYGDENKRELVRGIIAGGELALIHSLESFEDYPIYGEYQLREAGLTQDDLVIAITEGGETPFVLGAAEFATRITKQAVHLLFCNPKEILQNKVERSQVVLANSKIIGHELYVGAMALSGSTRMQASTVLQLAVGGVLFNWNQPFSAFEQQFRDFLKLSASEKEKAQLQELIGLESGAYKAKKSALYVSDSTLALTLLTDTTERAPTFSLPNFENIHDTLEAQSLSYVTLKDVKTSVEAWSALLSRAPFPLKEEKYWHNHLAQAGGQRLSGFDLSEQSRHRRRASPTLACNFELEFLDVGKSAWQTRYQGDLVWSTQEKDLHPLYQQTLLKMRLNLLSTLIMGRLDRFHSNIMTWVRPSNRKLIDRALRNIRYLLDQSRPELSAQWSDEKILEIIFNLKNKKTQNSPIVLDVLKVLLKDA